MKKVIKRFLCRPRAVLVLGAAAAALRMLLYLTAVDEKDLLIRNHPVSWLLIPVCVCAAAVILGLVRHQQGRGQYYHGEDAVGLKAVSNIAMAAGVLLTVLAGNAMQRALLVRLWQISGLLSAAGLIWTGLSRKKKNGMLLPVYAVLCLFFALQMVSRYQPWSGNPQVQDWLFSMLGLVGLTLCAYQHSTFCAGSGRYRTFLTVNLLTVFLCLCALPRTEYFWLYLCGAVWAYASLFRVTPVHEKKAEPGVETARETE